MNLDRDRIFYLFIAWISIVLWVTIRNCQKDFVPATDGKPGNIATRGLAASPSVISRTNPSATERGPIYLYATTNINEPLVEFPMSTNDIAVLQQIAPEAVGWDGLTQQQKLDSW